MSFLEPSAPSGAQTPLIAVSSPSHQAARKHPILRRLERLMDSTGEETDADSESLELALLDVELTKYAAHEGIHIPAASPAASAAASSMAQQLSTMVISPKKQQHIKPKPMQPGSVVQLVQQQSKFLDVLQSMIDKNVGTDKPPSQHGHKASSSSNALQAASAADAAAAGEHAAVSSAGGAEGTSDPQLGMLQVQYERQVADNHSLKKRCLKVQKAMLKHMQAARAQAAAAEAACEEARRREQQAAAANAALQSQLSQQQHMLEAQQQQLESMQEQLLQLKDLHKKKLTRYKAQLQQQYETQLAAATTAYTQELSLVHAVQMSAGERFTSSGGGASACSDGHPTPRQVTKKPRPSSSSGVAAGATAHSVLAAAAPAATAGSATKKSPTGQAAAAARTSPTHGLGVRSSSSGGGSSNGSKHAPAAAAVGTAAAATAAGGGGGKAKGTGGGRVSDTGSRRQSNAEDGEQAGSGAAGPGADAALTRSHRPSLPLEGEVSTQLLQQLSLAGHLPDPQFGSSTQAIGGSAAGQQKQHKQHGQRQSATQGGSTGAQKPETPRRATLNGSIPRLDPAMIESRAARAKTTPPCLLDGAASAAASPAAAAPAAEASGASAAAFNAAAPAAAVDGSVAVAVAQQLQSHLLLLLAQQLAEHLPPEFADIDPNAILSLQQAMAGGHVDAQQQQQQQHGEQQQEEEGDDGEEEELEEGGGGQEGQGQQYRQHGASGELNVPEDVLHYAQQYQQGGEGNCRPPTATPSALQHQRQQQVPEAAAQLAEHFVAGGEGSSRPLTAPSSDRSRAMQPQQQGQHQQGLQGPRSSSPSGRGGGRQAGMRNEHPAAPTAITAEG